ENIITATFNELSTQSGVVLTVASARSPFEGHLLNIEGSMVLDGLVSNYECFISYFTRTSGLAVFGTVGSSGTLRLTFQQQVTFDLNTVNFAGVSGSYTQAGRSLSENVFSGTLSLTVVSADT